VTLSAWLQTPIAPACGRAAIGDLEQGLAVECHLKAVVGRDHPQRMPWPAPSGASFIASWLRLPFSMR